MGAAVPYFPPWIPEDDLLLKNAVEVGASLESLARGAVLFSRRFSIKELHDRWHALLYHPEISAEAAVQMLEVESFPKPNRVGKREDLTHKKRKVDNVRNHYYAMRKRIRNEPVDFPDPCYHIQQSTEVGFVGSEGSHSQEPINKLIDVDCGEGVPTGDNFRVVEVGGDVECPDFPLLEGVVDSAVSGFHTTGSASLTNDLHLRIAANDSLYGYEHNHLSSVPVENDVGMGITPFHQDNLGKDVTKMLNENPISVHDSLETQENMQRPMEMSVMFVDHDLEEVKSLPIYDATDKVNANNFTGFGGSQASSSTTVHCKSPHSQPGYSAPEHSGPIWNTFGIPSPSSILNKGIDGNKRPTDATLVKPQVCHTNKISSSELVDMISEPNDAVVTSAAVDAPFSISRSEFMDLSDSLLECVNEGDLYLDGEKGMDRESLAGLSSMLLSSPKDIHEEDLSGSREPGELTPTACIKPVDAGYCIKVGTIQPLDSVSVDQLHVCVSEVNASSISIHNFCLPDSMVTESCLLNTEDPEIPCNEDFFPTKFHLPHSFSVVGYNVAQTAPSKSASDKQMGIPRIGSDRKLVYPITERKAHIGPYVPGASGLSDVGLKDVNHCERLKPEKHRSILASAASAYVGVGGEDSNLRRTTFPVQKSAKGVSLQARDNDLKSSKEGICYVQSFCQEDYVQCPTYGKGHPSDVVHGSKHETNSSIEVGNHTVESILEEQGAREVPVNNRHQIDSFEEVASLSISDKEELFYESEEDVPYFSDIEAMILDMDLPQDDHDAFFAEEECRYHQQMNKLDILKLERAVTSYTQKAATQQGALAVFYGRRLKHFITKPEVSLGRATQDNEVDIDLSAEGSGNRISRRQATIKMEEDGSFYLTNLGKHVLSVNNKDIASGCRLRLISGSLIEIRGFRFIFEANPKLVKQHVTMLAEHKVKNNANMNQSF